jgi:enterobactin synthetase component D
VSSDPIELQGLFDSGVSIQTEVLPLSLEAKAEVTRRGILLPSALSQAVASRQEAYLGGRLCAARGLESRASDTPLCERSPEGLPVWPAGFVGSIAHSEGLAIAVVATSKPQRERVRLRALGVDVESRIQGPAQDWARILARVGRSEEQTVPAGWEGVEWATLVFSAKESLYKALYPLVGRYFGFEAARITATGQGFRWELCEDLGGEWARGSGGEGRLIWREKRLFTGVSILQ